MSLKILPECYADTLLVEILSFKRPNHCASIGEVANRMRKNYKNKVAIGLIDKDKPGTVPSYFHGFELLKAAGRLELKWHTETKHFIIVLAPALETWLLDTASDIGVDAARYGFKKLKQLKQATKSHKARENQNLKDFFNTLKQKKNSPLQQMTFWIETILAHKGKIEKIKDEI